MESVASDVVHKGIKESEGKIAYELDWEFIKNMAIRMDKNKTKYPPYNWKKPMEVQGLSSAIARHHTEIQMENYDDEGVELGHLYALACNAMMLAYQLKQKNQITYFINGVKTKLNANQL